MYQYLTYGIIIHSDIPFYNLIQTEGPADAFVHYGKVSLAQDNSTSFYYSPQQVCFQTVNAYFLIQNGNEIVIQADEGVAPHDLAPFILGWGLAFLFTQRGFSALHCTALRINNKGILVSGVSGAGKSTTALALIKKGHKYLADDIAMFNPLNHTNIIPAYPLQKICRDSATQVDKNNLLYINEDRDKFAYSNTTEYYPYPTELHSVFLLNIADTDTINVEEITGLNKYLRILECLFLSEIYCHTKTPNDDKFRCLKLAEKVRVYVITRPSTGNSINEIIEIIERLA